MDSSPRTNLTLISFAVVFAGLAAAFLLSSSGEPALPEIPLVDQKILETAAVRQSYADLVSAKEDLSDYDCYGCHEKGNPPPLRFDPEGSLIIPAEHSNIVMGHGSHGRNNNCFNCHDENNLEFLQGRDGRPLKFSDSPQLCGSCHGPTYGDWEAGAHGRTSGYWDRELGGSRREQCVNCHDPHSPRFPGRKPAPGPHLLHSNGEVAADTGTPH